MLGSTISFHLAIAAQVLVALVSADGNERLDDLLERYLALLDDDSIVV